MLFKHDVEREQAIKLVRRMIQSYNGEKWIPLSVYSAIVSLTENEDGKFYEICIETLAELALKNAKISCLSKATDVLLKCIIHGTRSVSKIALISSRQVF